MAEDSGLMLRWKKGNSLASFVLPNSEVQPEVVCAEDDEFSGIVTVQRVYERIVQHIFRDPKIVTLERDSSKVINGRTHILYELWKAPHLPPINRHTKYVFRSGKGTVSMPLYVCAPVQITIETGVKASAGVGMALGAKGEGGLDRSTTFSMQVSAPVDPTLFFNVITNEKEPYDLYDAIYRYAADLSEEKKEKIAEGIIKRYEDYFSPDGGGVQVGYLEPLNLEEGQTVTVPLQLTPVRSGKTMVVVSASDDKGEVVYSDFIGVTCDVEARTVTRDF